MERLAHKMARWRMGDGLLNCERMNQVFVLVACPFQVSWNHFIPSTKCAFGVRTCQW